MLGATDPLGALQQLARAWRRELGARVVGGDWLDRQDVGQGRLPRDPAAANVHASRENFNTEIGLPLAILEAEPGTEALVLEMGMRGHSQIAELCAIAEPDVGVITNVGPVHLELLGSIEAVAAAKAELIDGVHEGGTVVVHAEPGHLEPHLPRAKRLLTFGEGGDVRARDIVAEERETRATVVTPNGELPFAFPFTEAHNLDNALAGIAAGLALDLPLEGMAQRAAGIVFSRLRGELVELPGDAILINDSYNANPVSMRAALDHLASRPAAGRRIAVLGDMRELGSHAARHHREIGEHAREVGVVHLIGVGELATRLRPRRPRPRRRRCRRGAARSARPGDAVLVKGSRAIGLERVADLLTAEEPA